MRRYTLLTLVTCLLLVFYPPAPLGAQASNTQPYAVSEFAVSLTPGVGELYPRLSGNVVVWSEFGRLGESSRTLHVRRLDGGQESTLTTAYPYGDYDLDAGRVVTVEYGAGRQGLALYRLEDGARRELIPLTEGLVLNAPRIAGDYVVWAQDTGGSTGSDIYGYDLAAGRLLPLCTDSAEQESPAVAGHMVIWLDRRHEPDSWARDIYGLDLAVGSEFRVTATSAELGPPVISGNAIAWLARADEGGSTSQNRMRLMTRDLSTGSTRMLRDALLPWSGRDLDIEGDLVVWAERQERCTFCPRADVDLLGYDLRQQRLFIVSRAIGQQLAPSLSGRTVVWADSRHGGLAESDTNDLDLYGATLQAGESPVPPLTGAPDTINTRIQIVWPHGNAPVSRAEYANLAAYLLLPGPLIPTPCQWRPDVLLMMAENNDVARPVGPATRDDQAPIWRVNNIPVGAARNPLNRLYFFLEVVDKSAALVDPSLPQDGFVHAAGNVWAHAADARTHFPQQDTPRAVASRLPWEAVDAKIEIVWPHGGASVDQADQVNVTAMLFVPDTLDSVPTEATPTVRLWRSQNNEVAQLVATGVKRLVTANGLTYPVWDFDNVDVSAARDPLNKYYFRLTVDEWDARSNVWVHGVDARTIFPQQDSLEGPCGP